MCSGATAPRTAAPAAAGDEPVRAGGRTIPRHRRRIVATGAACLAAALVVWCLSFPAAWLGFGRPVTWLVLLQNSDELRATGGFITGVATVRLDGGRPTVSVEKVYAAEGVAVSPGGPADAGRVTIQPPEPLARHMGIGDWRLRDANWSPDFPTSAAQAARFWRQLGRGNADGVVAVDDAAVAALLDAVGPIVLGDGRSLTGETVKDALLDQVGTPDGAGRLAEQSRLGRELSQALTTAVGRLPADRWPAMLAALRTAAERRDLQIAPSEPLLAGLAARFGVDGALVAPPGDFVAVVEQNLAYSKVSPFIAREIVYEVAIDEHGNPRRARLTLFTTNTYTAGAGRRGYPPNAYDGGRWLPDERRLDARPGYYGGYTTLIMPAGSRPTDAAAFPDRPAPNMTGGLPAVAGYVALDMGVTAVTSAAWEPPTGGADGTYRLTVRRQPGAPPSPVTIRVELPPGVSALQPDGVTVAPERVVEWHTTLDRDRRFTMRLRPDP